MSEPECGVLNEHEYDELSYDLDGADDLEYLGGGWNDNSVNLRIIHVDLTGDLITGIVLSVIVDWYLPTSEKLIIREGKFWMPMKYSEWWNACRISGRRARRSLELLKYLDLIETKVFQFNSTPVLHIRLIFREYLDQVFRFKMKHADDSFYPF